MNEEKRLQQVYNILDKFEENFLYKLKGIYQSRETYFSQRLENYYYALINNLGFEKYFQELLLLLFREGMKLGQNHASFEIEMLKMKDPYEKQTKSAMQYWDDYAIKLSKVEDKDLLNKLKETLQRGMKEGKTIQELQGEIGKVFPEFTKARLENIARTETAKAYNYGRLLTFYENTDLVQALKVSAIIDDRTCDICMSRNGMIIPLSDTGAIARNSPPFHYQCRCVLLPITIVDKRKPNYKARKYQDIPEPLEGFGLPDLSMITKYKPKIKPISKVAKTNKKLKKREFKSLEEMNVSSISLEEIEGERYFEPLGNVSDIDDILTKYGYDLNTEKIANMLGCGRLPGRKMLTMKLIEEKNLLIRIERITENSLESYNLKRIINLKEKSLSMESFILGINIQRKQIGAKVFNDAVEYSRQLGFKKLKTFAAKTGYYNGYYTWARFGYDAKYTDIFYPTSPRWKYFEEKGYKRMSDLMKVKEGREWWKVNGTDWNGVFDLSPDSISSKVWELYKKEKKLKMSDMESKRIKSDCFIIDGMTEKEFNEEMEILDNVWEIIDKEMKEGKIKPNFLE